MSLDPHYEAMTKYFKEHNLSGIVMLSTEDSGGIFYKMPNDAVLQPHRFEANEEGVETMILEEMETGSMRSVYRYFYAMLENLHKAQEQLRATFAAVDGKYSSNSAWKVPGIKDPEIKAESDAG